jgi:hypothetical protein
MDYNKIDVDAEVNAMVNAVERGEVRSATKRESMTVRLAALSGIVREMQNLVKNDKELSSVK